MNIFKRKSQKKTETDGVSESVRSDVSSEAVSVNETQISADTASTDAKEKAESAAKREKGIFARLRRFSPVVRICSLIPALLMLVLIAVAVIQSGGSEYRAELVLSVVIAVAAAFAGLLCLRLGKVSGWILTALAPAAAFLLTEFFTHNPFDMIATDGHPELFFMNLLFYYAAELFVLFLTGSMKAAVTVTSAVPMLFGIANYYTLEFRGTPLFPWDIMSAGIAADVVDNYTFVVSFRVCFIVCAFLFIIMLGLLCTPRIKLKLWWLRAPVAAVSAVAIMLGGLYVQSDEGVSELGMYPYLFTPKHVYKVNGAAVTFAYTLQFADIDKPDGYSPEKLSELMADYEAEEVTEDTVLPNVIVIMNEAFSDLRTAVNYNAAMPVTPYIDSMRSDTVKGTCHVSVKGGNTPNSEFEFLTGFSMSHFSAGSIPYMQYLEGETPSFASQLSELGYKTVAIHPYGASGWNRDKVYEWFGFDHFYSSADFTGSEKIRNYYSDAATYQKIIELYEAKNEGDRLFAFDVTMQNHGGYTTKHSNFTPSAYIAGFSNTGVTNTYLSLINKSDEAFGELVDYFATQSEPTVILMFGDHQPNDNVVRPLWNMNNISVENGTLEEQLLRYTVPFVMWANFDIEEETSVDISANYLSTLLCEKAGIPRTAAQMYLSELSEKYPVISAGHYRDANGSYYDAIAMERESELNDYAMLSYNAVADRKNLLSELFSYGKK